MTKLVNGVETPESAADLAQKAIDDVEGPALAAAAIAARAARVAAWADTPASVNSIPALRDEIDKIKQILRGEL